MSCYTVCDCLLRNLELEKKYITDVLMVFTQTNPYKVALDKSGCILDMYENIASKNEFVAHWLFLMTMKPSSFETINIDISRVLDKDEMFLNVCSSSKSQQKTIVYSHERWLNIEYTSPKVINYNGKLITVYDRDEAINELNPPSSNTTFINSTVAMDGSNIENSKNIIKK